MAGKQAVGDVVSGLWAMKDQATTAAVKEGLDLLASLDAIVDAVKYLIAQGLPQRGHDESRESENMGNLRELLELVRLRCPELDDLLIKPKGTVKYTSHQSIEKFTDVWAEDVRELIKKEISEAKYYALLGDEARDASNTEHMSISIRFLNKLGQIVERFIGLKQVADTKAPTLRDAIRDILERDYGISFEYLRGQAYDGASNMSGAVAGLQTLVKELQVLALYVHCCAHRLNLAVSTLAGCIPEVEECFSILQNVYNLCSASTKRAAMFKEMQAEALLEAVDNGLEIKKRPLKIVAMSTTRWNCRIRNILAVMQNYEHVITLLSIIGAERDENVAVARGVVSKLLDFKFVFTLHVMKEILSRTETLSKQLQLGDANIVGAITIIEAVLDQFKKMRTKEDMFDKLYTEVVAFCERHGIDCAEALSGNIGSKERSSRSGVYEDGAAVMIHRDAMTHLHDVDASSAVFECGDQVEGNFKSNGTWYPATVTAVIHDAEGARTVYNLHYNDGDKENEVASDRIRPLYFKGTITARSYVSSKAGFAYEVRASYLGESETVDGITRISLKPIMRKAKEYYKTEIYDAALDAMMNDLTARFSESTLVVYKSVSSFVPSKVEELTEFHLKDVMKLFQKNDSTGVVIMSDFTEEEKAGAIASLPRFQETVASATFQRKMDEIRAQTCDRLDKKKESKKEANMLDEEDFSELQEFREKLKSTFNDSLQLVTETLCALGLKGSFPEIYKIYTLLLVIPVSTASSERSFSAMKIVKTRLRTTMLDKEMSKQLFLYINKKLAKRVSTARILSLWWKENRESLRKANILASTPIRDETRETAESKSKGTRKSREARALQAYRRK
jgi:hypothetical protein